MSEIFFLKLSLSAKMFVFITDFFSSKGCTTVVGRKSKAAIRQYECTIVAGVTPNLRSI